MFDTLQVYLAPINMKKRSTSEQKRVVIAKLNLYRNEENHSTNSDDLEVAAKTFNIAKRTVSNIKREYWEIVDYGEIYSDIGPKKKERVVPSAY